jgi:predicted membrane channel-forming protein YqfA (hemolysin III family)
MSKVFWSSAAWLVAAGGLTYTVGVIFYKWGACGFQTQSGTVLFAAHRPAFFVAIVIGERSAA